MEEGEIKRYAQCRQDGYLRMSSTLIIYRIGQEDVGTYICEVNNGLGQSVKKIINLYYHCELSIVL